MIRIDYSGFINLDKNDMKILENRDGNMYALTKKEVAALTEEEVVRGLNKGIYYLDFPGCYAATLDGEEQFEYEIDGNFLDDEENDEGN